MGAQAKKKAQAAAKKAAGGGGAEPPPAVEPEAPVPETHASLPEKEAADEEAEEEAGAAKSDKKKKKKKAAKKEETLAPIARKPAGALAALKAAMEQKRLAEEEAKRLEEAEKRRIEEEERKAEEEERLKEEAKQKRKEKEKVVPFLCKLHLDADVFHQAKREQAKKEGRLLTKKQKEEKAAAEIRRKALIESGVKIEGWQQQHGPAGSPSAPKRVVYGSRKKKSPPAAAVKEAVAKEEERVEMAPELAAVPAVDAREDASSPKDDWEASEEEAETAESGVKDSWDASSNEDNPAPPGAAATGIGVIFVVVAPVEFTKFASQLISMRPI